MAAEELETVMRGFVAGEVDILVSTMIVESGLDVPNANTMVVHDAHRFGLAQLYQLRGRVGRSHRRAYCYLLVPDTIDADAEERLKVLEHHTDLGAGYRIALKDLELRGAGNLLGAEQSGHAQAVGFDLYMRWLEETVKALRGQGDHGAAARRRTWSSTGRPICRTATSRTTTSSSICTADWRGPRRLATLMGCEMNCANASGRCRPRPRRCSTWRGSAPWERCSAFSTCWCAETRPG